MTMNIESTETKRVWHKGPPPFVGWWNACEYNLGSTWRWWDGKAWSVALGANCQTEDTLAGLAKVRTTATRVRWNDYWPEDARVPRVDPGCSSTIYKGRMWAWIDGELVCSPATPEPAVLLARATDWERVARVQNAKLMAMIGTPEGFQKLREVMDRYEALSPTPSSTKEDAENYRLIRRGQFWSVIDGMGNVLRGDSLDNAVRAARTRPNGWREATPAPKAPPEAALTWVPSLRGVSAQDPGDDAGRGDWYQHGYTWGWNDCLRRIAEERVRAAGKGNAP